MMGVSVGIRIGEGAGRVDGLDIVRRQAVRTGAGLYEPRVVHPGRADESRVQVRGPVAVTPGGGATPPRA